MNKEMSGAHSGSSVGGTEKLGFMRRAAIVMFLVGAVTCAVGVRTKLQATTEFSRGGQWACAGGFLFCGLLLLVCPPRKPVVKCSVMASIVILGVLIAVSDPVGMGPLFYLWPMVFAAYFFTPRTLVGAFAVMVVSLGTGLALNPYEPLKLDTFTGVVSSVGLVAALVAVMNRREERLRRELARTAETDPLTGLLNRRAFDPKLEALIGAAEEQGRPLSLVIFDIDHFKRYNDLHGHLGGDEALRRLADVLRSQSRESDAVCRFGGEEFVVALSETAIEDARAYAERVALDLRSAPGHPDRAFSLSTGIASLSADLASAECLLTRADEALYAAKKAGRSRTAWWDGAVHVDKPLAAAA